MQKGNVARMERIHESMRQKFDHKVAIDEAIKIQYSKMHLH